MLFDNQVLQQLKKNQTVPNIVEGTVKATDKSYGFLECEKESYFIPPQSMRNLIHGDKIEAKIVQNGEKSFVEPVKLITPFLSRFVAKVQFVNGYLNVIPDHPSIKNTLRAKPIIKNHTFKNGDWVIANLTEHALVTGKPHMCEVTEFITDQNDPQAPWTVVLRGFDLPTEPPKDKDEYHVLDNNERKDLTNLPFVTIDSEKTKDMDDALYIEKREDGSWKLWVAIADPTAYISEDEPLDDYAKNRAFSIYLPAKDIPMLSRTLSDDLCSLRENEVRNALVGSFEIASDGKINEDIKFELATIKSQGKLIYDKVSDFLENIPTDFKPTPNVQNQIELLKDFANKRSEYRAKVSSTFKDKPEYEFILNDDGSLKDIKITTRRTANKIVEEAMIAANTCAGRFLAQNVNVGIFNAHLGFDEEKFNDLKSFLAEINYQIDDPEKLKTMEEFTKIKRFVDALDSDYFDARLRKFQQYAQFTTVPSSHYGLGLDYYATWTSPIRKYGDMINHRLIKSVISQQPKPKIPDEKTIETMNIAKKINRQAERSVKDWLYVKYLEPFMNNKTVFKAEIFDMSKSGLRVKFLENGASAFIPASFLAPNRTDIVYDVYKAVMNIKGEPTYKITDVIDVMIDKINFVTRSVTARPLA